MSAVSQKAPLCSTLPGIALAMLIAVSCSGRPTIDGRLQAELDRCVARYNLPGATAACVLRDGSTVAIASGMADVELQVEMTPQSRMLAASIGKTFVGATVLALAQDSMLSLDTPVSTWLGDREWFSRLPNGEAITLRHLLTHTSGLPNHVETETFAKALSRNWQSDEAAFSPEELIGFVLDQPPLFKPGDGWSYTDTGYLLIGLIIEQVTGQSYYTEVTRRFLAPLDLAHTEPSDSRTLPGLAAGYVAADNSFGLPVKTTSGPGHMVWHPGLEWTGGGLVSTSTDLAIWGKKLYEGDAISGDYLNELLRGYPINSSSPDSHYGLGTAVIQTDEFGVSYGHGGWMPGYCSSLRHYPEYGVAIAFQINTDIGIIDPGSSIMSDMEERLAEIILTERP